MTMASVTARSIRDRVTQVLESDRRIAFLSKLAWELVIAVRGRYPAPDTGAYREVGEYICLNEILHNLTSQLWSNLDHSKGGYPDGALIEGIFGKSRAWHCENASEEALRKAVVRTAPHASRTGANGSTKPVAAAIALLSSDRRREFLAEWIVQLTSATRAIRPPSNPELAALVAGLACLNEQLYLVAETLGTDLGSSDTAREDGQFVEALVVAVNAGGCGGYLRYAFERALASMAVPA
jgi:hypothetical protein